MISYTEQKQQWYEQYSRVSLEDQYEMIMELLNQAPPDDELINDDFGAVCVDLKSDLIGEKKYDEAIYIIEKTRETTTKFYQKEFPYLSNFAVEYYLYKGDLKKARVHLQPFIDNPNAGYDLFLPLFNKIRFYKMNDLALNIAQIIYEPIKDSTDLISGAEMELVDMIFYNLFQAFYIALENDQKLDLQQLEYELKKYDYDKAFFEVELPRIYQMLKKISEINNSPIFTKNEWMASIKENPIKAMRDLYWSFAIYMLKLGDFHFSISQEIWFKFSNLLMKRKSSSDFSFRHQDLEEVVGDFIGFLSNKEEVGFTFLWGIPYIYDFLEEQQLVSDKIKGQSLQYVETVKKRLMGTFKNDIWRFDFVHSWDKPASVPVEEFTAEQDIFRQSFTESRKKTVASSRTVPKIFSQMSMFEDLFGESDQEQSKSNQSKTDKKKKRKQAKI